MSSKHAYLTTTVLVLVQNDKFIYLFNQSDITDLKDFVNCTKFAQYTAEVINGQWQCVGPCKTNPDYCHQHGKCLNNIKEGPVCR